MTTLKTVRFHTLPVEAMFIYNGAVHEKLDDVEALNCHTLKTEDLRPDTLVSAFAD